MEKYIILFTYFMSCRIVSAISSSDPNACASVQTYTSSVSQSYLRSAVTRYTTTCFAIPPVCTRYRTYYYTAYMATYSTDVKTVYQCCSGYEFVNGSCQPYCYNNCFNEGTCTAPKTCVCNAGRAGKYCDSRCPFGTYGQNCTGICRCQHGYCDKATGECDCNDGWTGEYCDRPCQSGFYGSRCSSNCTCQNGATCNPIDGNCTCAPGYQGSTCEMKCEKGKWGLNCMNTCNCLNEAGCIPENGTCLCLSGWKGRRCELPCDAGFHGEDCALQCDCKNAAACDPVSGACVCRVGYKGEKCESICDEGTWGPDCSHNCSCLNGATCDPTSGVCLCASGYIGDDCSENCPSGTYGEQCSNDCKCQNGAWCDHKDGSCLCDPGYAGKFCERKCQKWFHGYQCDSACECVIHTTEHCDHVSGRCICLPGWTDRYCESECENGTWGMNCNNTCSCGDDILCDHVTGKCICEPGWTGRNCNETLAGHTSRLIGAMSTDLLVTIGVLPVIITVIATVVVFFCLKRRKTAKKKKTSSAPICTVSGQNECLQSSACCSSAVKPMERNQGTSAVENIYQDTLQRENPFPILTVLSKSDDIAVKYHNDTCASTSPKDISDLYANEEEAIYQEIDNEPCFQTNNGQEEQVQIMPADSQVCLSNGHANKMYGIATRGQELSQNGASQPAVYSKLNLDNENGITVSTDAYDKLRR